MNAYLTITIGLILLAGGADALVRGSVAIARLLGLSPLLIGLTLVGFGTSTPELVTSVTAALGGSAGIAVGNVVGSNIANILLILGLGALIAPVRIGLRGFTRDAAWLAASALVLLGLVFWGSIGRVSGALMLAAVVAYVVHVWRTESAKAEAHRASLAISDAPSLFSRPLPAAAMAIAGIAATVVGANLLVQGSNDLAREFAISETVIGLTIVAVGTSLPEMTTTLVAAWRRQADIAYGNIVGSNIFNILFILGAAALAAPYEVPAEIGRLDIWVMLAATSLLILFGWSGYRLSRVEGVILLSAYLIYVVYLIIGVTGG